MNRRSLIIGAPLALLGLKEQTASALHHIHTYRDGVVLLRQRTRRSASDDATPDASDSDIPSEFSFEILAPQQVMYIGMLATWFELQVAALGSVSSAMQGRDSDLIAGARENTGLTRALADDMAQFAGPIPFSEAHGHFSDASSLIADSLDNIIAGILSNSQRLINRATDEIGEATELINAFHAAMPFPLPNRLLVED